MKKKLNTIIKAGAVSLCILMLVACGVQQISPSQTPQVNGVAASGAPVVGTITLTDASVPARTRTIMSAANGSFSIDVSGLTPPFVLTVKWTDSSGTNQLYSFTLGPGTANINPFSNAAFAAAAQVDPSTLTTNMDPSLMRALSDRDRRQTVIQQLMQKLSSLFALYGTTQNPVDDEYEADHTGLDGMFDAVRITVANGMITVTNRATGGVIFTASVNDINGGTFYPQNMPGQTSQANGASLYTTYCSSCHGPLATSTKLGATATKIQYAIHNVDAMESLYRLTAYQIQSIASALSSTVTSTPTPTTTPTALTQAQATATCTPCHGLTVNGVVLKSGGYSMTDTTASSFLTTINSMIRKGASLAAGMTAQDYANFFASLSSTPTPTPTPVACTYTYDVLGACQSNNTQTRNMLTSSPSGCTGTPVTTQACTYVAPACTYNYDSWIACQPNNTQTRNMLTATPSGCSGTPVTTQACTYVAPACTYTYSTWNACQSNNTQTRNLLTSSPAGCTGTPVLSQSCTYVAPACTYTYSTWGACQTNNTQTRNLLTSSPAGCTGTPVLSQSCTYTPPAPTLTLAQVKASCTGCHGLTVNTTVLKSGGYTVTGRTASQWLSTVNTMVGFGASLASGTTAQDYANFLATLP